MKKYSYAAVVHSYKDNNTVMYVAAEVMFEGVIRCCSCQLLYHAYGCSTWVIAAYFAFCALMNCVTLVLNK